LGAEEGALPGACFATSPALAGEPAGGKAAGDDDDEPAAGESAEGEVETVASCAAVDTTEVRTRKNENRRGRSMRIKTFGSTKPTEK